MKGVITANGVVDEDTLEIQSWVEIYSFGPYEKVHFMDTGKIFTREEYNKWLSEKKKKEAKKRPKKASEPSPVETSAQEQPLEAQEG